MFSTNRPRNFQFPVYNPPVCTFLSEISAMSDPKPAAETPPRSPGPGMQRQMEIYQGILTGSRLSVPVQIEMLEKKAAEVEAEKQREKEPSLAAAQ